MTQEQKQFIIKALQSGIPAIAKRHIEAIEEVARVAEAKREDLNGQEDWKILNQRRHENIMETIFASVPFMADEYVRAYCDAVNISQSKFTENRNARLAKEEAEKKSAEAQPVPAEDTSAPKEEEQPAPEEKKKKSA